ncbi:2TM domain-containing protein [Aureisphaera galaxeae]|uniref:2TM domain-containing protein n=1 Tax=Aureisphaera galaxeae TaxID=1538023 RepID=UPI00234FBDC4|nr:2TM domain-containing protein [Aureisphaera galaxeae]MDC8003553.1 2TM domain-containing protein [Aureisphaera galaxeae]
MEPNSYEKYERAKNRVKEIRGFYSHIIIFFIINTCIYVLRFYLLPKWGVISDDEGFQNWLNWNTYLLPLFWAVGIAIHGIWTYRHKFVNIKKWEDRKIKEFMDEEDKETRRWK